MQPGCFSTPTSAEPQSPHPPAKPHESLLSGSATSELNLADGSRGGRGVHTTSLLSALTGAEDAVVVNNNAAALLLALAATSSGRAVPVARGELIEIGGSYRIPEVMEVSGGPD